ncbi:hypothetical protein E4T38_01810 [Aureobasidium subglaciale]|nr:hypothetical protein E4T38_01810 [Aureobasidium subglaciale]KAI5229256.1 hypothetical protein E4T40_01670 [Aureobasidium subglaciale]KAI5232988.1 hypothetical protein E4T41_01808 [Aureobasidium subglaciale]KAI5266356.1 hypothetical protein E4T46_01667 [Aureobasidium subglaciale]
MPTRTHTCLPHPSVSSTSARTMLGQASWLVPSVLCISALMQARPLCTKGKRDHGKQSIWQCYHQGRLLASRQSLHDSRCPTLYISLSALPRSAPPVLQTNLRDIYP